MELGKVKNLLKPENARYIPLMALGLGRWALSEIMGTPKQIKERQAASIQFYNTGDESGELSSDS